MTIVPHKIKHEHYRRCIVCLVLGMAICHFLFPEGVIIVECITGLAVAYDPTVVVHETWERIDG